MVSTGIICASGARDGRLSPRMDTGVQLRHVQLRQLSLCRHAAAASRHSPASEPRVRSLVRRSGGICLLGSCLRRWRLRGLATAVAVLCLAREYVVATATACRPQILPLRRMALTRRRCSATSCREMRRQLLGRRVETDGRSLRREQARQLSMCEHITTGPRHSSAPEALACLLGRYSDSL